MKTIILSDVTMKKTSKGNGFSLSFREKLELCKHLDRLGIDSIEMDAIENRRTDGLLIKSLCSAVKHARLTVPVSAGDSDGIDYTWNCLKEAVRPRLQVSLPVSTVQMEYLYHKKPEQMLSMISESTSKCRELCEEVEFCAEDAGRSDPVFLSKALEAAARNGASVLTVCDTAGIMMPEEVFRFIRSIKEQFPKQIVGVRISNEMYMADACAVYAVQAGAEEVKVKACGEDTVSLKRFAAVLKTRGESLEAASGVRMTEMNRTIEQIEWLCRTNRSKSSPFDNGVREEEDFFLNSHDSVEAVRKAAQQLGYDLSEEDTAKVYEAFTSVAGKKGSISAKELDVLIATSALQVPPTYQLESYVVNASNVIAATSHIRLKKEDQIQEGICAGDGPIDASFLAIEQIAGTHYELDDFQIRAVTEGREAMGEAIVRLRSNGKLYSGRGISTDIIGSSIMAYINAINKIVYEEAGQSTTPTYD